MTSAASPDVAARIGAFVAEAMTNGWVAVGDAGDLPAVVRDIVGDNPGVTFTEEGQRRLAALLATPAPMADLAGAEKLRELRKHSLGTQFSIGAAIGEPVRIAIVVATAWAPT